MKNHYEVKDGVVEIYLKKRDKTTIKTIISIEDFERVNENPLTWYPFYNKNNRSYYAVSNYIKEDGKRTIMYMQRWILNPPNDTICKVINMR